MATKRTGKGWLLVLLLLGGVLIGSVIGEVLGSYFDIPLFTKSISIGTTQPLSLDLLILDLTLGGALHVNFGTIVGLILGILLYKWTIK